MNAPPIDPDLIAWLQEQHPDRVPRPSDSDREVWMSVGRQQAISTIRMELARQSGPPEVPVPHKPTVSERFLRVLSRPFDSER